MKKRVFVRFIALLAALIMTVALASCAKSSNDLAFDEEMSYPDGGVSNEVGSTLPTYNEKGEMAELSDKAVPEGEFSPKIIKTATLDAETKDFSGAVTEIEASVKELGGYIVSCSVKNQNYSYSGGVASTRYATYVLRIPAERLDEFLSVAGQLLNVTSSSSNAEDISGEYYDIQARIAVLETEREIVSDMLSEAKDINTMISLEERLYDIIYEIESYKTAIKVYDGKVSYSTVNLSLREVADLTDIDADQSCGARVGRALGESWDNTVELGEELVIGLIYALPVILILLVLLIVASSVAFGIFLIIRGSVRRAARRKRNKI